MRGFSTGVAMAGSVLILLIAGGCGTTPESGPVQLTAASTRPTSPPNASRTGSPTPSSTPPAPSNVTSPATPAPSPAMATLTGSVKDGQLQAVVWAGMSAQGPLYPVTLMLDTGAQHTMVNGYFMKAVGDTPTGQTTTYAGIGGNEQVAFWPDVWVFPHDKAVNPIIAGQTEPDGVNRSALGPEGVMILLGQDVIQDGVLTQDGNAWSLEYPAQS